MRNFYFTSIEDRFVFDNWDDLPVDHVMIECDYPHSDGIWPNLQDIIKSEPRTLFGSGPGAHVLRERGHPLPPSTSLALVAVWSRDRLVKFGQAFVDGLTMTGIVEDAMFCPLDGDLFGTYRLTGRRVPLDEVALLSPTVPHRTLVVIGGFVQPGVQPRTAGELPRFAPKLVTEVSGDGGVISVPGYVTPPIWGEVELAAIVGHDLRNGSLAEAREAIFGYTCFNDVTAPEFLRQPSGRDYFSAKCIETFASMGPWIETSLTEDDLARGLGMRASVNGEQRVEASTADMKFGAAEIVWTASRTIALRAGDVISFGTPQWCALHPGDDFELEIECIGKLHNSVAAAAIG